MEESGRGLEETARLVSVFVTLEGVGINRRVVEEVTLGVFLSF